MMRQGRRWWRRAAVLACAAVCLCTTVGCGRDQEPETTTQTAEPTEANSVSVTGHLEASDGVAVTRRGLSWRYWSATIKEIIPEGSRVEVGDVLFKTDPTDKSRALENDEAQLRNAELAVVANRSALDTLKNRLEAARGVVPVRLTTLRMAVERLKNLPDPLELADAESDLARQEAILAGAAAHLRAVESLAEKGLAARQALLMAGSEHQTAEADLEYARARLEEVQRGADPSDLAVAETEVEIAAIDMELSIAAVELQAATAEVEVHGAQAEVLRAKVTVGTARRELEFCTRTSPKAGIVVYEELRRGRSSTEKVAAGASVRTAERVVSIISGKAFRFRAQASEALLSRMRVGLPARVTIDSLPNTALEGTVESFSILLEITEEADPSLVDLEVFKPKVFDVLIALEGVPEDTMPGLSGTARVDLPAEDTPAAAVAPPARGGLAGTMAFSGYVDALHKTHVTTPAIVMGYVTQVVSQYAHVNEGDVLFETTGDRARAAVEESAGQPEAAREALEVAREAVEVEERRAELIERRAALALRLAEMRCRKLASLPLPTTLRMAEARLRGARIGVERARRLLEADRAAGLASRKQLEAEELDVRLAETQVEQASARLDLVRMGANKHDLETAAHREERARQEVDHARRRAEQSGRARRAAMASAEANLTGAERYLGFLQEELGRRIQRAPAGGDVVMVPGRQTREPLSLGDYLPGGAGPFGYICDLDRLKFRAVVEQPYAARVRIGDSAAVMLLVLPDRLLAGKVIALVPMMRDRAELREADPEPPRFSQVKCTRVDIALDLPDGAPVRLLPGMTGSAFLSLHEVGHAD